MNRHQLREHVFLLVFRAAFYSYEDMPEQIRLYIEEMEEPAREEDAELIEKKSSAVFARLSELDKLINERTDHWNTDRMGKVELAIVRLALYEMLFDDEVPQKVAVDEAVNLAREYGQDGSGQFVNGVLARFISDDGEKQNK